jgi:hypothetical protein
MGALPPDPRRISDQKKSGARPALLLVKTLLPAVLAEGETKSGRTVLVEGETKSDRTVLAEGETKKAPVIRGLFNSLRKDQRFAWLVSRPM